MAESNVELVEKLFAAFRARDDNAIRPLLHPEAEYLAPDTARLAGRTEPYKGFDGLQDYLHDISVVWGEMRVVSLRFEAVKEGVLVEGRIVTRDKKGRLVDAPAAWFVEVEAGQVVRLTLFRDLDKAAPPEEL